MNRRLTWLRRLDSVVWISLLVLVLFAGFVVLLWGLGLFDTKSGRSNAQVVASALALVGGLFAACLTFIGVLLKNSIDERTLRQAEQTEGRLTLETSIRAVELLTEDGKPAAPVRQAGALFVLASLNQVDFAVALLGQIWPRREVTPGAAAWVVNRALLSGSEGLQNQAAAILQANAPALVTETGYEFPDCVNLAWPTTVAANARESVLAALMTMLVSKARDEWEETHVASVLVQLEVIRREETLGYIKDTATRCLGALLETPFFDGDFDLFAPMGMGTINVGMLRTQVDAHMATMNVDESISSVIALAERVRDEWLDDEPETD